MKYLYIIGILTIMVSCIEYETQYYESGVVKLKVSKNEYGRNGIMNEYYENGSLKAKSEWENNVIHGINQQYYLNGQLKATFLWHNGAKEGEVYGYYNSGAIKFKGQYKQNVIVGKNSFYFENGQLMEDQIYSNNGILQDFYKYDSLGKQRMDLMKPIYFFDKDSILLGEEIEIKLRLGNRVSDNLSVMIGSLPDDEKLGLIDTVAVVSHKDFLFKYKFKPTQTGKDSITGKIIHVVSIDSVEHIYEFAFAYSFYVMEGRLI